VSPRLLITNPIARCPLVPPLLLLSKILENHAAAVALHYMHYNFARIHRTLRITPAMAAGLTDHVWSIEEIIGLLEIAEKTAA